MTRHVARERHGPLATDEMDAGPDFFDGDRRIIHIQKNIFKRANAGDLRN
jgi:hypothetical protein